MQVKRNMRGYQHLGPTSLSKKWIEKKFDNFSEKLERKNIFATKQKGGTCLPV